MEFPVHGAPTSLALDGNGNLFVGYQDLPYDGSSHVAEFPAGSRTSTTLPLRFTSLQALTFDAQGDLLAADAQAGTISVYPRGAKQPSAVLTGFTMGIFSMTLNATGDRLFVANGYEVDEVTYPAGKKVGTIPSQSINVFSVAASPPLVPARERTFATSVPAQTGHIERALGRPRQGWLAPPVRGESGLLYVAAANDTIDIFPRNQSRELVGQITAGVSGPAAMTTDAAGDLYVGNATSNTVTFYKAGTVDPAKTYSSGISGPNGLAVDAKGTLYVSNGSAGAITEYARGSMTPTATISGVYTLGLGVDGSRNLYDLVGGASGSDATASVYEYAPGSTNGVFTGIQLASTIQGASGLAVSSNGTVAVLFGDLICFPHASGNGQFYSMGNATAAAFTREGARIYAIDGTFATADELIYPDGNHNNSIAIDGPTAIAVTGS